MPFASPLYANLTTSMLTWNEIRARCAAFSDRWKHASDEDAEAKSFWDDLFTCFGANRRQVASFEAPVRMLNGNLGYVDLLWKGKLVVEHKSRGKDLAAARRQGLDYIERLKPHERPRWLIACDFARFEVHDLHSDKEDKIDLADLSACAEVLGFLAGYEPKRPSEEAPVNIEAVERLGSLYDAMKAGGYPPQDLPLFLVRVMFCLFGEDTGVFGRDVFTDFINYRTSEDGGDLGPRLAQFFHVLDTPKDKRQTVLDELLAGLDYVNGSLFAGHLAFAEMTGSMRAALLACTEFDWSRISPAIFGSLFQGVMDGKDRRAIGAHYTSERDILKVINPLFLDGLRTELSAILTGPERGREAKLHSFHDKLAALQFLDPACGCGNFLIITYRELRKLEIQILRALYGSGQLVTDVSILTKVRVEQFHGIEIEEFPSTIARVAMWLMDHIENIELGHSFGFTFTRLPLTGGAHIVHGNALQIDWETVIAPARCSYIMGNPPFIGSKLLRPDQKEDVQRVFGAMASGVTDYVGCWYRLCVDFCKVNPAVKCALVSTSSITQGEQVAALWPPLFAEGLKIHFAHRTFEWTSEARGKAHVHCVIIGFALFDICLKQLSEYPTPKSDPKCSTVSRINCYLIDGNDLAIPPRSKPLNAPRPMVNGSIPADGGNLLLSADERTDLIARHPEAAPFVMEYVGAEGLINGNDRFCLWLVDCPPEVIRAIPDFIERIRKVREFRLQSTKAATKAKAAIASLFTENRQPATGVYLAFPRTSSETRKYIPIAYLPAEVIAANDIQMVPSADAFQFGILTSAMHMAWTAAVTGRLKSDYRYSSKVAYNNFPWPTEATNPQRMKVEECAQAVLAAREQFPGSTLADLYDPNAMPPLLTKAHEQLDRAVDRCYRTESFSSDRERVEFLFGLYEVLARSFIDGQNKRKSVNQKL